MSELEKKISLLPLSFYAFSVDCHYLKNKENLYKLDNYSLPSTGLFFQEETFAKVSMGWNEEGIYLLIAFKIAFKQSFFPEIEKGDSVELFFDTRDIKSSGFNTRFCHHFFFLPQAFEGRQAGEMTHFRTEDRHELCDFSLLKCQTTFAAKNYKMAIFIPKEALHGYDPIQFDRLGFSYRLHRAKGTAQHFSVSSEEFMVEQQPSLWSSVKLIK